VTNPPSDESPSDESKRNVAI